MMIIFEAGQIVLEVFPAAAGESGVKQLCFLQNRLFSRFIELISRQVGVATEWNSGFFLVFILFLRGII